MTIQQIPLESMQKIRQYIQNLMAVPDSENHPPLQPIGGIGQDPPEPGSLDALGDLFKFAVLPEENVHNPNLKGRWFISVVNPGAALLKLPGLYLKTGFRLVSYLCRQDSDGQGVTWAVAETFSSTAELEKVLDDCAESEVPRPKQALEDFMEALDGDRSSGSFIVASVLKREIQEFGALGKCCSWSQHRLIKEIPTQVKWQWRSEIPKNLSPKVRFFDDGRVAVEFFSCRVVAPVGLYRHVDLYPAVGYKANSANQEIATL